MIKLVIFDLDGTLLDTIGDLASSVNYALRCHGYPEHNLAQYRYFVGRGVNKLLERALPESDRDEETVLGLKKDFVAYYSKHNTDLTQPYEGIPELLADLYVRGITLAVASNKYHEATAELVDLYFGPEVFQVVYGQREGVAPKPDPTIVRDILAEVACEESEVLYVGDSGVDMQTATACGLQAVGVTWGFRPRTELEANGANYLIDRPEELLALLQ